MAQECLPGHLKHQAAPKPSCSIPSQLAAKWDSCGGISPVSGVQMRHISKLSSTSTMAVIPSPSSSCK